MSSQITKIFEIESRGFYRVKAKTLEEAIKKITENEVDPVDCFCHFYYKIPEDER